MDRLVFDYSSLRAKKARRLVRFGRVSLSNLNIDVDDRSLSGWGDAKVIGHLPKNPSPKDVARAIDRSGEGEFFAVRFGLDYKFIVESASDNVIDTSKFWRHVVEIMHDTASSLATADVMIVALVKMQDHPISILPALLIDENDLYQGIRWHNRMLNLASSEVASRRHTIDKISKELKFAAKHNVVIAGPKGVGKSITVRQYLLSLHKDTNRLYIDAANLVDGKKTSIEIKKYLMSELRKFGKSSLRVLVIDDCHMLLDERFDSIDASELLHPILEDEFVSTVMVFEDSKLKSILGRYKELSKLSNRVIMSTMDEFDTMLVLQDEIARLEKLHGVTFMYQALKESYHINAKDVSMPGRAVDTIRSSVAHAKKRIVTAQSVVDGLNSK